MRPVVSRGTGKPRQKTLRALVTLALWQIRQVWRIFLLVAVGMMAAVLLVGAMPLFAKVNTTASMRSAFANSGFDPSSSVQATIEIPDSSAINQTLQQLQRDYQQQGSPFFDLPPDVSIHIDSTPVYQSNGQASLSNQLLTIHGYDTGHIASHIHLLRGRLPQTTGKATNTVLEIALTVDNAAALGAHIGSTYTIDATEITTAQGSVPPMISLPITLKVVGILSNLSATAFEEPFWHGDELNYLPPSNGPSSDNVITSNPGLLALFDYLSHIENQAGTLHFPSGASLSVYFPFDISAISSDTIDELQPRLDSLTNGEPSRLTSLFVDNARIDNTTLTSINATLKNLTSVAQLPVLTLLSCMMGLILFFVTLMTELLVIRQAEAIALMRSRGATIRQIFLIFVVQSLLLGLLTVLLGPLLIPLLIRAMVITLFPPIAQTALNILPTTPWGMLFALGWYVWIAALLGVLTMCLSVWRTLRNSTLGRSRTLGEGVQHSLWRRLFADGVVALLGVLTYGLYIYLTSLGIITAQLQVVLVAPCMLVATTLFCVGAVLLSLRLLSHLVQLGAKLAAQGRGITMMLSLVMMARAPRQALRTTLFLIFTIAFTLFAQVFLATQAQRAVDLSNYVASADFSGFLPSVNAFSGTFEQQEAAYRNIPGVLSVTLASIGDERFQSAGSTTSLTVIATDPSSIGNSITWPHGDNLTTIRALFVHLADQRRALTADLAKAQQGRLNEALPPIPAIVSTATKNLLHLSIGKRFFMSGVNSNGAVSFLDSGEVSYLPGVPTISADQGILVDYASFNAASNVIIAQGVPLAPTMVWLHTRQDSASLRHVQQTLSSGPLALHPLISHQRVLATLQDDPLLLNLLCMLELGIGLALLLAWIGCLVSAWSYVRTRLRSLLVLRALGSTPAQLALLLSCEQVIIYTFALILGVGCGAGFTALTLPDVVFSGTALPGEITSVFTLDLFQLQSTPPLQTIIPSTIVIGLGVVVLLCAAGIGLTATMVIRLSPARMLRLSEDYREEALLPPEKQNAGVHLSHQEERMEKRSGLRHAIELGRTLTPLRRSWSTLGLTQMGVVISVLFVCVVPLFSQVAATAGLHDVLTLPENRMAVATNSSSDTVPLGQVQAALAQGTNTLNKGVFGHAGSYFHTAPIVTLSMAHIEPTQGTPAQSTPASSLTFVSISAGALANQVRMLQGHLPQQGATLQILLTPQAANYLHVHVGDVLTRAQGYPLDMRLVGLFQPRGNATTLLPPAANFFYYSDPKNLASGTAAALTSTEGLALALDASRRLQPSGSSVLTGIVTWNYPIDQTVTSLQLDNLITALSSLSLGQPGGTLTLSTITTPVGALQEYQQSIIVSSIPILSTSLLIIALLLLFLNFMVGLLVERESSAIALLRSRGATRYQIFAAFLKRALLINAIGLLAGMALAIPVIIVLTRLTLQPEDQAGLLLLTDHPWQTLWSLAGFAFASIGVTLCAMGLMLLQATRTDYLSLRKETTRETRKPLWQRWYLDLVGIVIALTVYGFSLYLTSRGIFDPTVNVQVKSPLVLTATLCLVMACILVLLRLFPLLLRLGTKLTRRNRGIASMLSLSQMAHAPRQRQRTVLLLLLTTAFVVFAVVFNASQTQHINDTAQYWAGADFSGSLPHALTPDQVGNVQNAYEHVKGMTSVALGDMETVEVSNGSSEMQMLAIDPQRFIHTVIWPGLDTSAQQKMLIDHLKNPFQFPGLKEAWLAAPNDAIPAVIDTTSSQELQVQPGQTFTADSSIGQIAIFVVAEVDEMPATNILVDYSTYNLIYQAQLADFSAVQSASAPINTIWLKTDGRAQSWQYIRQTLEMGPLHLSTFYDRQATVQALTHNPLNRNLVGILALGTFAPLLLTWIGCLIASLVEMRQRQLLFGVLRALGSTPTELARVLGWEQALIFSTSIVLGLLFGLLAAFLALPSLVLTPVLPKGTAAGGDTLASGVQDLFSWQNTPAAHTVIPPELGMVVASLIILALLAIALMRRSALNVALGQTLRLNED
jgi:ABC-type lipoprotein release transport system permease subunit